MKWKKKEQEQEGNYFFSGRFLYTRGIQSLLTLDEITEIYQLILKLVKEKNGLDYLHVFVHEETGQKLFFIDQLDKGMVDSGDYAKEYNYCTLILAEEY